MNVVGIPGGQHRLAAGFGGFHEKGHKCPQLRAIRHGSPVHQVFVAGQGLHLHEIVERHRRFQLFPGAGVGQFEKFPVLAGRPDQQVFPSLCQFRFGDTGFSRRRQVRCMGERDQLEE